MSAGQATGRVGEQQPVTIFTAERVPLQAWRDLVNGLQRTDMWWRFATFDIKQRFRRSIIGPLWLTLSMGIMVGAMGFVFSTIFQQEMSELLPYIAAGLIFWGFLTSCINEGATVFINSGDYIRNVPIPLSTHLYRMIARNFIILCFNMAIYVLMLLIYPHPRNFNYLLAIPGFAIFLLNAAWISFALAIVSARYRDIPQVAANLLQVIFFLTPIFWSAKSLPRRPSFIEMNPIYHLIEIVRTPLLGGQPSAVSWIATLVLLVFGCSATWLLYKRAYPRIAYWV